jgi:hypothetical protein
MKMSKYFKKLLTSSLRHNEKHQTEQASSFTIFRPTKVEADGSKANCSDMAFSHLVTSDKYRMLLETLQGLALLWKVEQSRVE